MPLFSLAMGFPIKGFWLVKICQFVIGKILELYEYKKPFAVDIILFFSFKPIAKC